jgi:hypothetical protein
MRSEMMKVAVIPADMNRPVRIEEIQQVTLEYTQKQVGGSIEGITINRPGAEEADWEMYLNEEGKLLGLPLNPRATALASGVLGLRDYIAGDAMITGPIDDEGRETGLDDDQAAWLVLL